MDSHLLLCLSYCLYCGLGSMHGSFSLFEQLSESQRDQAFPISKAVSRSPSEVI